MADVPTVYSNGELQAMYPQARGELLSFARALAANNAGITAAQIRMTIQLADRAYAELTKGKT